MSTSPKIIIDCLRNADKEIKNFNLETAMGYINKIFELEHKNVYAKAYKERIISLMEAQGLSRVDAEQKATLAKVIEPAAPPAAEPQKAEPAAQEAPKPIPVESTKTEAKKPEQEQPKQSPAEGKKAEVKKAEPVQTEQPKQIPAEGKKIETKKPEPVIPPVPATAVELPKKPAQEQLKYLQIRRSAAASDAYKTLLMEIWKDGSISSDEQSRIDSMRETFAITAEEHAVIEKNVRIASYLHSIREDWSKGITDFAPLRKKFLITDREQITIEPKVFQLLQSLQSKGSVLVLDDEESFLRIIKDVLNEGGYYCFTAMRGEDGLQLLETMTPDIVVCDVNFSKPNMSGFAFYEKFRSNDKFLTTPFIFLSGLDQDVLVRTAKKLGADDYLFKPIDAEMLLSTIEGKLRRSRELKRLMSLE